MGSFETGVHKLADNLAHEMTDELAHESRRQHDLAKTLTRFRVLVYWWVIGRPRIGRSVTQQNDYSGGDQDIGRNEEPQAHLSPKSSSYAAFFDSDSTSNATRSDTSNSRVVTPAAIAGVTRSVRWILMKLYAK